jgi:phage terminase large subunit-like protein
MGVDPAAGGDNSAIVIKSGNLQEIVFNQKLQDTMDLVGRIMDIYNKYGVDMICIDKTGVGQGIYDRIRELNFPVRGIAFGEKSEDPMFGNMKAELHWRERKFSSVIFSVLL